MYRKFEGKLALVTGVSRLEGLGAAICKSLAQDGADIYFTYWRNYDRQMPWNMKDNEPEEIQSIIERFDVKCHAKELDLSKSENISLLFNNVTERMGTPSILVNNAAYSTYTSYQTITPEELDRHYYVNIRLATMLSAYFARAIDHSDGASIINITSGQFKGPMVGEVAYATTKGALDALTITLSAELASKRITVNSVNPGPIDTGWMTDHLKEDLRKRFPLGRIGQPEDAAELINFLASDEGAWITGQIINSEGGFIR